MFYLMAVLVLNEVDKLSREAQHSLRRTMEKYSASCRLILCCNSSSKVTEAVRSRCLNIRVNAPTNDQVCKNVIVVLFLVLFLRVCMLHAVVYPFLVKYFYQHAFQRLYDLVLQLFH